MPTMLEIYDRLLAENAGYERQLGLPSGMYDQASFFPPGHEVTQATTRYIEGILGRLYQARSKEYKPGDIQIAVSANQNLDFGIFVDETMAKPVLKISIGALKYGLSEDQLAGVIAHELSHKNLREIVKLGAVGKGEELFADARGAILAGDAGYQRDALLALSRSLAADEARYSQYGFQKRLKILTDEHPSWDNRVRRLEDVETYLARSRGDQLDARGEPVKATPIPDSIVELGKSTEYHNVMQRLFAETKFNEKSPVEQMGMIQELIATHKDIKLTHSAKGVIEETVRTIALDTHNADHVAAMHSLADTMVEASSKNASHNTLVKLPNSYAEAYAFLEMNYALKLSGGSIQRAMSRPALLGENARLDDAMRRFIRAGDSAEALEAARTINAIASRHYTKEGRFEHIDIGDLYGRRDIDSPNRLYHRYFPNFTLPDVNTIRNTPQGLTPSWEAHVGWAQRQAGSDALEIWRAIHMTGGHHDPRVMAAVPDLAGKSHVQAALYPGETTDPANAYRYNDEGKIVGHNDILPEYVPYERQQTQLLRAQDNALASANWGKLETDFWGFIADNRAALTPPTFDLQEESVPYNKLHAHAPFVEAFLGKVEEGLAKGTVLKSDVQIFFAPDASVEKTSRWNGFKPPLVSKYTLDALIQTQAAQSGHDMRSLSSTVNGVHTNHPYVQFMLRQPKELIDIPSRLHLAESFNVLDPSTSHKTNMQDRWLIDPYRMLDLDRGMETGELLKLLRDESLISLQREDNFKNPYTRAVLDSLAQRDTALPLDQLVLLNQLRANNMGMDNVWGHYQTELMSAIPGAINLYYDEARRTGADLPKLINDYHHLSAAATIGDERYSLFDLVPQGRTGFEALIKAKFDSITDPQERGRIAEFLLHRRELPQAMLGHEYNSTTKRYETRTAPLHFSGKIANPELRQLFIEAHSHALSLRLGKDDGSLAYQERLKHVIDSVTANTDALVAANVLSQIATDIEAQPQSAHFIRDEITRNSLASALDNPWRATLGEITLHGITDNDSIRISTLDFLTSPLTTASTDTYYERLSAISRQKLLQALGRDNGLTIVNSQKASFVGKLSDIHNNLWALPLEARSAALSDLLFPAQNKDPARHAVNVELAKHLGVPTNTNITPELKALLSSVHGKGAPSTGATLERRFTVEQVHNNTEVRRFVQAYVANLPEGEQRLILSALVAARTPGGDTKTLGQVVRQAMSAAGPAGDKLLQAVHSHPNISDGFRSELGDPKADASPLQRWQIIERLEAEGVLTSENAEKRGLAPVAHVGEVIGSGSYGVTVKLIREDGKETAVTLLRENAAVRSKREFGAMSQGAEKLIAQSPDYAPIQGMVKQAAASSVIETNMVFARRQGEIARANYDGMSIMVDGEAFHFATAAWLGEGPGFKETEIIHGTHFNDLYRYHSDAEVKRIIDTQYSHLPVQDRQKLGVDNIDASALSLEDNAAITSKLEHRTKTATAMVTAEWYLMLHGGSFDHDRHGSQQRIMGNAIGHFDFGGVSLEPMEGGQKVLFGKMLADVMKAKAMGQAPIKAMKAAVQRYGVSESDHMFLGSIERTFLAQQDYMKHVDPEKISNVIASIIHSGDVDPMIYASMQEELGILGRQRFNQTVVELNENSIIIEPAVGIERHGRSPDQLAAEGKAQIVEHQRTSSSPAILGEIGGARVAARVGGVLAIIDLQNRGEKIATAIESGQSIKALAEGGIGATALGAAAADMVSITALRGASLAAKASLPAAVAYGIFETSMGLYEGDTKRAMDGVGGTSGALAGGMAGARFAQLVPNGIPYVSSLGKGAVMLAGGAVGYMIGSHTANEAAAILYSNPDGSILSGSQMYHQIDSLIKDAEIGRGGWDELWQRKYAIEDNANIDKTKYPAALALYRQIQASLQAQGNTVEQAQKAAIGIIMGEAYSRFLDDGDPQMFRSPYNPLDNPRIATLIGGEADFVKQLVEQNSIGLQAATQFGNTYPIEAYNTLTNLWHMPRAQRLSDPGMVLLRERYQPVLDAITIDEDKKVVFGIGAEQKELSALLQDATTLIQSGKIPVLPNALTLHVETAPKDITLQNLKLIGGSLGMLEEGVPVIDLAAIKQKNTSPSNTIDQPQLTPVNVEQPAASKPEEKARSSKTTDFSAINDMGIVVEQPKEEGPMGADKLAVKQKPTAATAQL